MRNRWSLISIISLMALTPSHASDDAPGSFSFLGRGIQNKSTNESILFACVSSECKSVRLVQLKPKTKPAWLGNAFPIENFAQVSRKMREWYKNRFVRKLDNIFYSTQIQVFTNQSGWNWAEHPLRLKTDRFSKLVSTVLYFAEYHHTEANEKPELTRTEVLGELIQKTANFEFWGCSVKLNDQGFHRLYINDQINSSFAVGDEEKLKKAIEDAFLSGGCRLKVYTGKSELIQKVSEGVYAGCTLTLNDRGYNRLYLENTLAHSYVIGRDDELMLADIERHFKIGKCRVRNYTGSFPLINAAINHELYGCFVKKDSNGYLEFFQTDARSPEKYVIEIQDQILEDRLNELVKQGLCRKK